MDQLHFSTTVLLLNAGYNVLLEKPVTADKTELLTLERKAHENGRILIICHVLRYTPFYLSVKKLIASGAIGEVVNIQMNEHVCYKLFVKAFVRGKWRNEKLSGSGLLLAKSCHDIDLMCWLNNAAVPAEVSSFGSKATFSLDKAPVGSTEFCFDCPAKDNCMFNAYMFELEHDSIPFYTWADIDKPLESITREEKLQYLKKGDFGRCVYRTDMDIVDRQCVSVNFSNGSIGTLNLVGGTSKADRHIHVIGTMGEIVGYIENSKITLRIFDKEKINYDEKIIQSDDMLATMEKDNSVKGHYGGDYYLMKDVLNLLNGNETSLSTTTIDDSMWGHLCCYAAEESRKQKRIVALADYKLSPSP